MTTLDALNVVLRETNERLDRAGGAVFVEVSTDGWAMSVATYQSTPTRLICYHTFSISSPAEMDEACAYISKVGLPRGRTGPRVAEK